MAFGSPVGLDLSKCTVSTDGGKTTQTMTEWLLSMLTTANIGVAGGAAGISSDGNLVVGSKEILGTDGNNLILVIDVPTVDPKIKGAAWNNGGYFCISAGE